VLQLKLSHKLLLRLPPLNPVETLQNTRKKWCARLTHSRLLPMLLPLHKSPRWLVNSFGLLSNNLWSSRCLPSSRSRLTWASSVRVVELRPKLAPHLNKRTSRRLLTTCRLLLTALQSSHGCILVSAMSLKKWWLNITNNATSTATRCSSWTRPSIRHGLMLTVLCLRRIRTLSSVGVRTSIFGLARMLLKARRLGSNRMLAKLPKLSLHNKPNLLK